MSLITSNTSISDTVNQKAKEEAKLALQKSVQDYNNLTNKTLELAAKQKVAQANLTTVMNNPNSSADDKRLAQAEYDNLTNEKSAAVQQLAAGQDEYKANQQSLKNITTESTLSTSNQTNTAENDISTPTNIDTTSLTAEVNAAKVANDNSTTADVDVEGEEPVKTDSIEVRKVNSSSIYTGVQVTAGSQLTAERVKYYQSNDKTQGFIIPWDGRLGYTYSSTQSVGNHMPYGDEWVGSPSMANPYALIRFDHIAGKNHHKYLLDQRNQQGGFRGTVYKPYANIGDFGNAKTETNGLQETVVKLGTSDRSSLGVTDSDGNIYSDQTGALYVNENDESQQIWKPTKDVPRVGKSTYKTTDDPSILTVDTPLAGQNADIARMNRSRELKANYNQKKISGIIAGVDSNALAAETASLSSNDKTPTQKEFWIIKQGWVRCRTSNPVEELLVDPAHCDGGTSSKAGNIKKTENPESVKQLKSAAKDMDLYIDEQLKRGWTNFGNPTKKRYLKKMNSKPVLREPVEPTAQNLVDSTNWTGKEQFQYRWVDFLFCKYYMFIPNNYMVTLRRFPMPVNDQVTVPDQDKTKQHLLPVAMAVTWMGNQPGNIIGDLMSFSYRMNWGDLPAEINEVQGNEQGAESSPFGEGVAKWLGILSGQASFSSVSGWDEQRAKFDPYKDGMYANRIYGPVNVIAKTKRRERGLEFEHSINLNFHYVLKSIGGINPKAAMLDIMANILALTYNNAGFWGGANRYFPNKPAYPFLGGKKGMSSWYSGNVTGFLDGIADQLTSAVKNLGSFIQNLLTNPKEALKSLAGKGAQLFMAEKQKDKRPGILGLKALLTGDPVGEWHLVIGNPFNPIMMIGNLICTSTKITFGDQLGADDFPTEMIVTITLEHGRPRDKGDIESMFNRGGGRLHYSYYGTNSEYWNQASSTKESNIDCPTCKTTAIDNFTGKTRTFAATSRGNFGGAANAPFGNPVNNAFPASIGMEKFFSFTTKQAVNLSEKIGFQSGGK